MLMTSFTASPVVVKLIHIDLLMRVLLGFGVSKIIFLLLSKKQRTDFSVCMRYVEVWCLNPAHVLPNPVVVVLNG